MARSPRALILIRPRRYVCEWIWRNVTVCIVLCFFLHGGIEISNKNVVMIVTGILFKSIDENTLIVYQVPVVKARGSGGLSPPLLPFEPLQ